MSALRTDQELLRSFRDTKSEEDFKLLVDRHLGMVFGTALRIVNDASTAEDLAQNVFIALAKKSWLLCNRADLVTWLHKAAVLEARRWQRSEFRRRTREQVAVELGGIMERQFSHSELTAALDGALLKLRQTDRETLILRYFEGLTYQQVGERLGVREDAARKRAEKALKELSRILQNSGHPDSSLAATSAVLGAAIRTVPPALVQRTCEAAVKASTSSGLASCFGGIGLVVRVLLNIKPLHIALVFAIPIIWQGVSLYQVGREHARLKRELEIAQLRQQENAIALADVHSRLANAARSGSSRDSSGTNLYAWNPQSKYVRLPKKIFSKVTFAEMAKEPSETLQIALFQAWQKGPAQKCFFDSAGSPSKPFLSALGLTDTQASAVTDACKELFAGFRELEKQHQQLMNETRASESGETFKEGYSLVTPRFRAEGEGLEARFTNILARTIGPERTSIFLKHARTETHMRLNDFGRSEQVKSVLLDMSGKLYSAHSYEVLPGLSTTNTSGLIYFGWAPVPGLQFPLPQPLQDILQLWQSEERTNTIDND